MGADMGYEGKEETVRRSTSNGTDDFSIKPPEHAGNVITPVASPTLSAKTPALAYRASPSAPAAPHRTPTASPLKQNRSHYFTMPATVSPVEWKCSLTQGGSYEQHNTQAI